MEKYCIISRVTTTGSFRRVAILHATLDPFLTESFCFDWSGARGRRFTGFRVWSQTVWEFIEIHQELFVKTNCHTELFLIISEPTSPHVCFIVLRQKIITPLNSRNNREYRRRHSHIRWRKAVGPSGSPHDVNVRTPNPYSGILEV